MTFWQFLDTHKTKITGFLLVIATTLQGSPQLPVLLPEAALHAVQLILSLVVVGIGFLNGHTAAKQGGSP